MNAMNPGGIMPKSARTGTDDGVRLTFDLDEEEVEGAMAPPSSATGVGGDGRDPRAAGVDRDTLAQGRGAGRSPADDVPRARPKSTVPSRLSAVEVTVTVELGSQRLSLRDLLAIEPGQLFSLDRLTAEPVDILVNGRPFARGEVVAIGDRFGVRLTDLVDEGDPA
jgi:flagellar motor switch protein FliN/FliY